MKPLNLTPVGIGVRGNQSLLSSSSGVKPGQQAMLKKLKNWSWMGKSLAVSDIMKYEWYVNETHPKLLDHFDGATLFAGLEPWMSRSCQDQCLTFVKGLEYWRTGDGNDDDDGIAPDTYTAEEEELDLFLSSSAVVYSSAHFFRYMNVTYWLSLMKAVNHSLPIFQKLPKTRSFPNALARFPNDQPYLTREALLCKFHHMAANLEIAKQLVHWQWYLEWYNYICHVLHFFGIDKIDKDIVIFDVESDSPLKLVRFLQPFGLYLNTAFYTHTSLVNKRVRKYPTREAQENYYQRKVLPMILTHASEYVQIRTVCGLDVH
ncbi:hypothetical protein RFI_03539 [Reticulomyxa filosa]|uniref:Uncharacterized protein n=1 Tax=Reticulomyxa filosa TaxID=46433 RepID=X6P648_RETFI|nr:hypothetical protein RFI_03539 [Reticulomyxa filosa]|eukprot:ETO33564.1 hypothetical protein RFI_03539 [Reticulomyxa filosa]